MYFLIYRSQATQPITDQVLKDILAKSRERNPAMGVTGMLLFFDNKFMQLLEGEESQVKLLYKDICADTRHTAVITLKEGPTSIRLFPEWSMSFRSLTQEEIAAEPAYKDVYTPGSSGAHDLRSLFNLLRGK
ncbi:MAG: hypothetical protein K0S09_2556 [Sphingobacteriaceae bacterium]|jgi:hypothetical protein|nr:hypothetical protein [Sphingobacteriaceae bacterium]